MPADRTSRAGAPDFVVTAIAVGFEASRQGAARRGVESTGRPLTKRFVRPLVVDAPKACDARLLVAQIGAGGCVVSHSCSAAHHFDVEASVPIDEDVLHAAAVLQRPTRCHDGVSGFRNDDRRDAVVNGRKGVTALTVGL